MIDVRSELQRMRAALRDDLRANPDARYVQLAAIEKALQDLDGRPVRRRVGGKKALFRTAVTSLIESEGGLVHRSKVLEHLKSIGFFTGGGTERVMSKYLSMDQTFQPEGCGMWKCRTGEPETLGEARNDT